jgi:L-asparaginase II
VYAVGVACPGGAGYGIAVKIEDGHERAYLPVIVEALHWLRLWSEVPAELAGFREVPILNTQKVLVGRVRSVLAW